MDTSVAIERNREALKHILAMLVAMAGAAFPTHACGGAVTMPRHLRLAVLRLLRPAESAARRLIIAMACGIVAPLQRSCKAKPAPAFVRDGEGTGIVRLAGIVLGLASSPAPACPALGASVPGDAGAVGAAQSRVRPIAFPLLDSLRHPFAVRRRIAARDMPRVWAPGAADRPVLPLRLRPSPDDMVDAARLGLRLAALAGALDDLPGQALRFARWKVRNDALRDAGLTRRTSPLRPGRPPGGRLARFDPDARRGRDIREVDEVLAESHALARWAVDHPDTS